MLKIQTKLLPYHCTHQSLRHAICLWYNITSNFIRDHHSEVEAFREYTFVPGILQSTRFSTWIFFRVDDSQIQLRRKSEFHGGREVKMICFPLPSTALYQASVIQKQLWKFWSPIKRTAIMKVFHPFLSFSFSLFRALSVFLPSSVWPGVARCTIRRDSKLNP